MAIITGTSYKFYFGTVAQYEAAKTAEKINANDLYFLTDTKQIYVGEDLYTGSVEFVTTFPNSPSQGVIYCNPTTHETKVWDGTAWKVMNLPVDTSIDGTTSANDGNLATIGAIKTFVSGEIGSSYTITKATQADAGYAATYQLFKGSVAVGDKINIPKDLVVESGELKYCTVEDEPVEGMHVGDPYIELTLANAASGANKIYIPVKDLVDTYTVDDTDSVSLTMNNNEITADVNISDNTGNIISVVSTSGHEGLFAEHYIGSVSDTDDIDLTVTNKALSASVNISNSTGNKLQSESGKGLFVAPDYIGSIDDTTTVDLTVNNAQLTAAVKIDSVTGDNILTSNANGLYVAPQTWSQISAS